MAKLSIFPAAVLVLLGALAVEIADSQCTSTLPGVCPRQLYSTRRVSYQVSSIQPTTVSFTESCGFWGWRRCTRYRTQNTVQYDAQYRSVRFSYCQNQCCSGYRAVGSTCIRNICVPECTNGGTCGRTGVCACPSGWTGSSCETPICSQGCQNGGTCIGPGRCRCRGGYVGNDCSRPICPNSCQFGGTCIRPFVCQCRPGRTGVSCQEALCEPPCQNRGRCEGLGVCRCREGFTGDSCELGICDPPCENGLVCRGPNICDL